MDSKQYKIVEILQRKTSNLSKSEIESLVCKNYISTLPDCTHESRFICAKSNCEVELYNNVEEISIFNGPSETNVMLVYKTNDAGPVTETLRCDDGNEELPATCHWILPSRDFHGMWENLYYADGLKENLLRFAETMITFSLRNVDRNVICCNRLMLLHGPPGTGKTSLCKALAQKISIRCSNIFKYTHLIEINSHSLFSKWFSESGKLVMTLFDEIKKILNHKQSLVCLLIDEVESIAFSRGTVSANEPSDSLRVVNAVLTQLDQIRHYPNLIVLTTSNLTSSIDPAFIDRADITQFIDHPSQLAISKIYISSIDALIQSDIISKSTVPENWSVACCESNLLESDVEFNGKNEVINLVAISCGLSGRSLRKIPFLAYSLHIKNIGTVTLCDFVEAMQKAVIQHKSNSIVQN